MSHKNTPWKNTLAVSLTVVVAQNLGTSVPQRALASVLEQDATTHHGSNLAQVDPMSTPDRHNTASDSSKKPFCIVPSPSSHLVRPSVDLVTGQIRDVLM